MPCSGQGGNDGIEHHIIQHENGSTSCNVPTVPYKDPCAVEDADQNVAKIHPSEDCSWSVWFADKGPGIDETQMNCQVYITFQMENAQLAGSI